MAHVHLVLQGKGGVGKTFVATMLTQYLFRHGSVDCVDTDPVNATFAGFEHLGATRLELLEDDAIQPRRFDSLIELADRTKASHVVIDNGASAFVALALYLVENDIPGLLQDMGHRLIVHAVITGGQGFRRLRRESEGHGADLLAGGRVVVWLNPYFGAVKMRGKTFEEMKVYEQCRERVRALVICRPGPRTPSAGYGRDAGRAAELRRGAGRRRSAASVVPPTTQTRPAAAVRAPRCGGAGLMAKGYEELIQEVLVKHGVALGDQDPILVLHTINRKLADDLSSSLEEALTDLKQELEQLYFRWEVESKSKAERILAAATAAAKDHLETRATELSGSSCHLGCRGQRCRRATSGADR